MTREDLDKLRTRVAVLMLFAVTSSALAWMPHGVGASIAIGMDILDTTPASTFAQNTATSQMAGSGYMLLGLGWNQIEPTTPSDCTTAGTYTDPYGGALGTFNTYLPSNNLKLSLSILPISTNINMMPSNLVASNFDDSLVICRFNMMLTWVFAKIPDITLVSIQVGNEVDAYPAATNVSFWSQYWTFVENAVSTIHALRPNSKVSITGTLYGAVGQSSNAIAQGGLSSLWSISDMVDVTYYPLNIDYTAKSPSVAMIDISALAGLFHSRNILFNEVGFPSGSAAGGSNLLQQEFVQNVISAARLNNIGGVLFLRLNDLSLSAAQTKAGEYGLSSNAIFVNYIQTLGLQDYTGIAKPALSYLESMRQ